MTASMNLAYCTCSAPCMQSEKGNMCTNSCAGTHICAHY